MSRKFRNSQSLKGRESYSKRKKCSKSEKLLEGLKVAPNLKSCSKVAEQLMDSLHEVPIRNVEQKDCGILTDVCLRRASPSHIRPYNEGYSPF